MQQLRRSALALGVSVATAGIGADVHASPAPPEPLTIAPARAEVWAPEIVFSGEATARLERCRVVSSVSDLSAFVDGARWSARVPVAPGESSVDVTCQDERGREHRAPTAHVRGMLREPRAVARRPVGRSARDAVVYGVVPPLFGQPPLRAVTAALPDLAELGADVLWLAPIAQNAPRDYGYAVTDYLRVRPDYGTREDLAELVEQAHEHGMRVVLDFVPNHTSDRHRYFEEGQQLGERSHYWSFYAREPNGSATHYFDWAHLPNLDYGNAEVSRWMREAARRWIEDMGVDGFRLDVAWGIEQRAPAFFDALVADLRAVDPRAILFAEGSARDPFWHAHGFDGAYDWTDAPGQWSWNDVFGAEDVADRLDAAVVASPAHTLRFLENNDTGPRFVTRHGVGAARVASAALLALPGIPLLFTGQERGAEYEPYMRGDPLEHADPHGLREHHRAWIALRHRLAALRSDAYARLATTPSDARVLAFQRGEGADVALVVLRFDERGAKTRVLLPEALRASTWRDGFDGTAVATEGGAITLDLEPWSARVLVAQR